MNTKKRRHYLQAMGIETWSLRAVATPDLDSAVQAEDINKMNWQALQAAVVTCTRCSLYKTRLNTVFGVGNQQADLVFIGEAPGATEDQQGTPFVGRAGQLLDAMLRAIKINRAEIFITNILKSRPPENRDPSVAEVNACTPYLIRQLALIKPKLIVAVGRIAAQFLLNSKEPLTKLRGREFSYSAQQIPLLVTYHPAYLLRAPRDKAKAWEDLQQIALRLQELQRL